MPVSALRSRLGSRYLARAVASCALGAGVVAALGAGWSGPASAGATNPLVVYSSEGYGALVARAFQHDTGIRVQLVTNKLATLAKRIEATKRRPQWAVFWADGPTVMASLDSQHLLAKGLRPTASWNGLGRASIPKDRSFIPTGVTLTAAILYTKNVVSPPTTWLQLLGSQWKGKVGMTTPRMVGSDYPFIAGMIAQRAGTNSVTEGERYFAGLKKNRVKVYTSTGVAIHELTRGRIKLALVQSSAAVGAQHTDPNLAVAYLPAVTAVPASIAVDVKATATEKYEAEKFVDFVLSPTGQKAMENGTRQADSNYYPVVNGSQPLPTLPAISTIRVQRITPYVWAPRQASITAWFVKHVAK